MGDVRRYHSDWISDERWFDPEPIEGEHWKPVMQYQGRVFLNECQISDMGRVKGASGKILKAYSSACDEQSITILADDGSTINVKVDLCVLYAFKGNPPADSFECKCYHINDDLADNRVTNITWACDDENGQTIIATESFSDDSHISEASSSDLHIVSNVESNSAKTNKDITELCAYELGKLVYDKAISPVEIMTEFKSKIEDHNPGLNAFVYTKFDEAFEEAENVQKRLDSGEYAGMFAGCPIGLKDFLPTKKGWTASHGGVPSLITTDEYDSEFWKTAKKLGCIAVGKTNAPAFGFRGLTDNKMYGPTKNPYNTEYNSGGSSGGSASAVGGKLVPLSIGGDAGGSIRIPAAWCGCFGFKPSARIVPDVCRPDAWTATHPYCCDGPITRSVKDAAIMMNHAVKYNPRDPLSVPLSFDFVQALARPASELTVGITYNFDLFPDPDPQIIRAINSVVDQLKELGIPFKFVNFSFSHELEDYQHAWLRGICIDTAIEAELTKNELDLYSLGDELPEVFYEWNKKAFESSVIDYRQFHEVRTDVLDAHLNVFDDVDIIIAPVTGCLPVKNSTDGTLTKGPEYIGGVKVDPLIGFGYTYLENMIGTPAASLPITYSVNEHLPIGIQVIGKRYRDEDVFTLCAALESLNK